MSNTSPKLRFSVFRNEWVGRSLLSLSERIGDGIHSTPKYDSEGEYYFINGNNLVEGTIALDENTKRLNAQEYEKHARKLGQGTILISINGTIGNIALYNNERIILGKSVCYINTNSEIDKFFLYYLLNSSRIQKYFINELTGSTIKNLSLKSISKTLVYLPTIQEQQKIASFLSSVDEWINNLKEQKELLQQYKKGIMQKIFSQEIRFKDENGNEFPGWEEKKLGKTNLYISDGNYGEQYPKSDQFVHSGVPFIRANNIKNLRVIWDDMKYIPPELHDVLLSGHLLEEDILITTRGDIGMLAHVTKEFEGSNINAQVCLLRVGNDLVSKFLLNFLSSKEGQKQLKRMQTGSALKQLPIGTLVKIEIPVPLIGEQQKIASFLSSIDAIIDEKVEQINQADVWKKGLMQGLFI